MESKLSFKEAVRLELDAIRSIEGKVSEDKIEATMARLGLRQDLCEIGNDWPRVYSLDEETRDRLIAHARQDAALAYYSSNNTKKAVRGLRNIVWLFGLINVTLLIVLVFR